MCIEHVNAKTLLILNFSRVRARVYLIHIKFIFNFIFYKIFISTNLLNVPKK